MKKPTRILMVLAGLAMFVLPARAMAYDYDYGHGGHRSWVREHRADRDCDHDHDRDWGRAHYRPTAYPREYTRGYPGYQYNANAGAIQYRQALLDRDARMRALYGHAVENGNRKMAKYYGAQIKNTDKQYNVTTRRLESQGGLPYAANPSVTPWTQHGFGY
jgi:hypothetical protein